MTTATDASVGDLTMEHYIFSMEEWLSRALTLTSRARRGHALFSREDLLQNARLTLVEVYNKYAGKVLEGELRRIGTRAVYYDAGNKQYREFGRTTRKQLEADPGMRRTRPNHRYVDVDDCAASLAYRPTPLDSAIVREEVGRALGAASLVADPSDTRPGVLPSAEAMKIFRRTGREVRDVLRRIGGYGPPRLATTAAEEDTMFDASTPSIESPDASSAAVTAPPKPKRQRKAEDNARCDVSVPAPEATKTEAAKYAKDQVVAYAGGGRMSWMKPGTKLVVRSTVVCRGRSYVRCVVASSKRAVALSPYLIRPDKK